MFPAGLEPATFRVWGGRDNHYTTETVIEQRLNINEPVGKLYAVHTSNGLSIGLVRGPQK